MKKTFGLLAGLTLLAGVSFAYADCWTESNGYYFSGFTAQDAIIACDANPYTLDADCVDNARCDVPIPYPPYPGPEPRPPHPPGPGPQPHPPGPGPQPHPPGPGPEPHPPGPGPQPHPPGPQPHPPGPRPFDSMDASYLNY